MIAVVIPYFQRQEGILRRALTSVMAQQGCSMPVHVIVVDDQSPVSAADETRDLKLPCYTLEVITQPNGGPGAARNTGLERVPPGTRYVAFLDSDDEWSADHLVRAAQTLEAGYDFYFADLLQLDQTVGAFARAGRIDPAQHPAIGEPRDGLHAYQGDMFDQIVRGNVIGTPTVVYRFDKAPLVRFRTDLTSAGEDYLFWMTLARAGLRIAFSSRVEATCGRGVNVYSGTAWASDEYFIRVRNELSYRKATGELFRVNQDQLLHLRHSIAELRRAFAGALLHRLRHGHRVRAPLLKAHLATDPLSFLAIPGAALRILSRHQ